MTRDIVARTIIRIGEPAIDKLIELSTTKDNYLLFQIIDTLGGLLHATGDLRILDRLTLLFKKSKQNDFLLWKMIRAFSAIESERTTNLIMSYCQNVEI